jgi:hypothetical protein
MEKLLKKGAKEVITRVYCMEAKQEVGSVPPNLQHILDKHDRLPKYFIGASSNKRL